MKATKGLPALLAAGKQAEQAKDWKEAASAYQKIVDQDPGHPEAVSRLVLVYRKLKDYHKELTVIDGALAASEQREKEAQTKWLQEHPKAATAGKALLRLGDAGVAAFGADAKIALWLKRREFVEKRLGKKKPRTTPATIKKVTAAKKKQAAATARKPATAPRKQIPTTRKQTVPLKQAAATRKQAAATRKQAAATRKQAAATRKQAAATRKLPPAVPMHPSLFIITLRYLADLEKIDASMSAHVSYLQKHFEKGEFLVAGRQIPRTGGIIIAKAKDRAAIEHIVKADPFLKKKLATVDIVEFSATRVARTWKI